MESIEVYIQFAAWATILSGVVTPNVINLLKNMGFEWPNWFKTAVSVVGAAVASFVAIGLGAGWDVVQLWPPDWTGFVAPVLAGMLATYPMQLTAWRNLWKDTRPGEFVASIGTGHP